MTTPHNVYVVTTGEYSYYKIHSVWATGKEAEAYADRLEDANEVEEWVLRSGLPEPLEYFELSGRYPEDDLCRRAREAGPKSHQGWADDPEMVRKAVAIAHDRVVTTSIGGRFYLQVWGTDPVRVGKAFTELWAQSIANFDVLVEGQRVLDEKRDEDYASYARATKEQPPPEGVDSWKVWRSLDPSLDGEAKIAAYRTAVLS